MEADQVSGANQGVPDQEAGQEDLWIRKNAGDAPKVDDTGRNGSRTA